MRGGSSGPKCKKNPHPCKNRKDAAPSVVWLWCELTSCAVRKLRYEGWSTRPKAAGAARPTKSNSKPKMAPVKSAAIKPELNFAIVIVAQIWEALRRAQHAAPLREKPHQKNRRARRRKC